MIGMLGFVAASLLLARSLRGDARWRSLAGPALVLSPVVVAFAGFIASSPFGGRGIGQRVFLAAVLLRLVPASTRLRSLPGAPAGDRAGA